MSSIKKLAGQTLWYGMSSIAARFINYLLTPYLTYKLSEVTYGEQNTLYAIIPFLNVLFTYGMETAYFRFSSTPESERTVFNMGTISILLSTSLLSFLVILIRQPLASLLNLGNHPEFIIWGVAIIILDALTTLPFAKLRYEGKPRKYAMIRLSTIMVNVLFVYLFYSVLPAIVEQNPGSPFCVLYRKDMGAGYYLIANIISSALALILLLPEFIKIRFEWNADLWKKMMLYSLPIMVAGLGGMINETLDRIMLGWWTPGINHIEKMRQVGIYSACYKLAMLISLFIQAFRLGAEPFLFKQMNNASAPQLYSRIMNFFVITVCGMFLVVTLYLDVWRHFIQNKNMWSGLAVVPILLCANIALGIYYNLAIWYKTSKSTYPGVIITLIGAGITCSINFLFIPSYGYMACAWATLICYASMMTISFFWGQRVYAIPYPVKRLSAYFLVMLVLYFVNTGIDSTLATFYLRMLKGTILLLLYIAFVIFMERDELKKFPAFGRLFK